MRILYEPDANDPVGSSPPAETAVPLDDKQQSPAPSTEAPPSDSDVKEPETLSDVIARAQERASKAATDDEGKPPGVVQPLDKTQAADKKEPSKADAEEGKTKEDEVPPPFHEHPAWKRVIAERDEARTKVVEFEKNKPLIEHQESLIAFCRENRIEPKQFQEGLELIALIQTDPAKAYEQLAKVTEALAPYAGAKLPDDLQKKVTEGVLDNETATELARLRADKAFGANRSKLSVEDQQQKVQTDMTTALNGWNETKKKTDADFGRKLDLINGRFLSLVHGKDERGLPLNPVRTPADAVTLAERAYSEVNKSLETFRPAPARKRVITSNGSGKTKDEEPTTLTEAIGRGLKEKHGIDFNGSNGD